MKALVTSKRYLRVFLALMKIHIQAILEYRLDFFINIFTQIISIATYIVLIEVIFNHTDNLAGWSKYEIIFIYGIFAALKPLLVNFIFINLSNLSKVIVNGELDKFLSKPISTLFLISFANVNFLEMGKGIVGICIIIYALPHINLLINLASITLFVFMLLMLIIIFYCIFLSFFTLSFWLGPISHGFWIFDSLSSIGTLPLSAFKGGWNIVFNILLPFVLYGAVPAGIMLGKFDYNYVFIYLVVALIWTIIAIFTWKKGLGSYTSANL